jgi:hypothetical protein
MDKLKELIEQHRDEFDEFEPSDEVWANISFQLKQEQSQPKPKHVFWRAWPARLGMAASVTALLMVAGVATFRWGQSSVQTPVAAVAEVNTSKSQLAEVEKYYAQMIAQKQNQLSQYDLKTLGLEGESDFKMAELDSAYVVLRQELATNPDQQKIIDAMTRNLQMRMFVLSRQLEVLQKLSQKNSSKKNENIVL